MHTRITDMDKLKTILTSLILAATIALVFSSCESGGGSDSKKGSITITANRKRANPGDTVVFTVALNSLKQPGQTEVFIVIPAKGTEKLAVERVPGTDVKFTGRIILNDESPEGFYVVTAVHGTGDRQVSAKASFLTGKVVLDFAIMANFDDSAALADMESYLGTFTKAGGNALTLHANMATERVWGGTSSIRAVWASEICKKAVDRSGDRIEMMLNLTDKMGIPSLLSVSWDLTDSTLVNSGYLNSIHNITDEMWKMFGHHPSLAGFYSYQEGSGTYFANYIRDFCRNVKHNDQGLMTMCAPNIDDPLLAGYLAAIDELDIINYQAPVMTSYRPDNRKLFPNRRVKDVTSLSAGATRITDKITLSHVEFMGYLENNVGGAYLTDYANIFNQFPSVGSAFGTDGITFFSYFSCIYFNSKKLPAEAAVAASAVDDGMKAFRLISRETANRSGHLAFYIPYNDWCIERWTNCFLPATDAMARLGISTEIIPFIPKKGEEILPYYPMHKNEEQLNYLIDNKYVLILPDISGMQETDSEMLEAFVRNGGVVIAFGPRIPYGDRFNREEFWGASEISPVQAGLKVDGVRILRSPGTRSKPEQVIELPPQTSTSWNPATEKRIADFLDGSCAVFSSPYNKGKTYVVALSLNEAVNGFPDLVRDIIDDALGNHGIIRPFDVYGMRDNMDVAMNGNTMESSLVIANYNDIPVEVMVKPSMKDWDRFHSLTDLRSGREITGNTMRDTDGFRIKISSNDFIAVRLTLTDDQK